MDDLWNWSSEALNKASDAATKTFSDTCRAWLPSSSGSAVDGRSNNNNNSKEHWSDRLLRPLFGNDDDKDLSGGRSLLPILGGDGVFPLSSFPRPGDPAFLATTAAIAIGALLTAYLVLRLLPSSTTTKRRSRSANDDDDDKEELDYDATIESLLLYTNERRLAGASSGLLASRSKKKNAVLTLNEKLSKSALRHAKSMAKHGYFSHTGWDASSLSDRVRKTKYKYSQIAENLFNQSPHNDPYKVVQGWMNSRGHRENLMNLEMTEVGFGYAKTDYDPTAEPGKRVKHYYVQVLGRPVYKGTYSRSSTASSTQSSSSWWPKWASSQ